MLIRLWHLLEPADRRRVMWMTPLLVVAGGVEVLGVAAVIPFITLLADPSGAYALPVVGPLLRTAGQDDPLLLLRWTAVVLAAVLLVANTLVIFTNWWVYRVAWSLYHRLSSRLVRHYLSQPYTYTLTQNTATLSNKVMMEVRRLIQNGFLALLEILSRGIVIVALVSFLVLLDPLLAVVVFGVLGGAYTGIFGLSRRYLRRIGQESVFLGGERLKAVNEALAGMKDLKVTGREASAFARYDRPTYRHAQVEAAQHALTMLPRYALEAIAVSGMVLIAALLSGRTGTFTSTLPVLGAYAFAGIRLMPLMQQLFAAFSRSRFAEGSLDAVEADLLHSGSGEGDLDSSYAPMQFKRSITLRGVRYSYPGGLEPVLDDVTLTIPRLSSVALVGRTGSGKTTLVDVILGLLEPDAGSVEVDGVPIESPTRRSYRRLFGYVPQDVFLLDDTVRRNVALGLDDADIDQGAVLRACELAQIAQFIEEEMPYGYDTVVGERGVRLSGGQRQRIGIARALYHQPEVLVFDEATSALDMHTERQLYAALHAIAESHTVITIAHRLETVAKADTAIVLANGRVIDLGTPSEVIGRYRQDGGAAVEGNDARGRTPATP